MVAVTVPVNVPVAVGVPLSTPVTLMVTPVGNEPALTKYVGAPVAVYVKL